jgi:glycine/D-amino acid oxidase-like deaminating enzyme
VTQSADVIVVGGGIFGITGALALRKRGRSVVLLDPGPLPHPLAASTDLSKCIRMDYGADAFYAELMERALEGWRALNAEWGVPLFHETGVTFITRRPFAPGVFERESYELLRARGHALERLDAGGIARRFPPFAFGPYVDGYYNPEGGWAESGRVVAKLVEEAKRAGVVIREGERVLELTEEISFVTGVRTESATLEAETVVVAAGAWTPSLVPELASAVRIVGQPVLCFTPSEPRALASLVPWSADVSQTGWYGFPMHPSGVLKVANHGPGVPIDPDAPRTLPHDTEARFRTFLRQSLPDLAEAPSASRRLCLYADSIDGDLWIAPVPSRPGLVVATGGSGHGFKFAPVLGEIIADAVDAVPNPASARFGWRDVAARAFEAARHAD